MSYQELEAIFDTIKHKKRAEWERWRMQCFYSMRLILKEETQPKDLIPLPWDDEGQPKKKLKSEEEQRDIFERMSGKKMLTP